MIAVKTLTDLTQLATAMVGISIINIDTTRAASIVGIEMRGLKAEKLAAEVRAGATTIVEIVVAGGEFEVEVEVMVTEIGAEVRKVGEGEVGVEPCPQLGVEVETEVEVEAGTDEVRIEAAGEGVAVHLWIWTGLSR